MGLKEFREAVTEVNRTVLAPPTDLTLSEWADQYRRLSAESAAEPGRWLTKRAEYQRGIMDAITEPGVHRVVLMCSAQVGKTEIINNVVGYHMDQDPSPILVLQPTLDMAQTWSKDRLAPMLRDTPTLRDKVADPRARDSGNTVLHKRFPGGHITVVGANSASGLASRPIRVVLADEVDRYPPSAGTEGDPLSLAIKRTATFWNRRVVMVSTPGVKDISRIEREWNQSDQREYHCTCPHCEHPQVLKWGNVKWPKGRPAEAAYHCEECGVEWSDSDRRKAIQDGYWEARHPERAVVGFHLNEIYSPWSNLGDMATAFLNAKGDPETLKAWVNTSLGEPWEDAAEKVDPHLLANRTEDWGDKAPNDVLVITAGVDVQVDRLEIERVGWGEGEESWSLDHRIFYGDPSGPEVWEELNAYLHEPTTRADGAEVPIHCTAIDSGGHHTQQVYQFCADKFRRRVFAIKGVAGQGRPVWPKRASKGAKIKVPLFPVGVDSAKDTVYARLQMQEAGPGYCHFPEGRDHQYFDQLTAEVVQTKYVKGFPTRVYYLPQGKRNEALDLRVYAYAALQALNIRWGKLLASSRFAGAPQRPSADAQPEEGAAPEPGTKASPPPELQQGATRRRRRRVARSNWADG